MYAIVVPTETRALSLFWSTLPFIFKFVCVLRTIHIREVCVNVNAVESSRVESSQVKECVVFGRPFVVATRDEIIANLHKTAHNLNGIRLKSIVMINSPYTK